MNSRAEATPRDAGKPASESKMKNSSADRQPEYSDAGDAMLKRPFWIHPLEEDHPELRERQIPSRTSWSGYRWGRHDENGGRRQTEGSVLMNHVEGWAILTESGKSSVNTIAHDAEDAVSRLLSGDIVDPDSTRGRKIVAARKARYRATKEDTKG